MQEGKKRLRKKLAEKAIEKMRRNICIEYRLPSEVYRARIIKFWRLIYAAIKR